jgi:ferredoxin--NADP+ reductase
MYPIVRKEILADKIFLMEVKAERCAKACLPGQFVIVRTDERGERIPLTICGYNREAGTVTIVIQAVGASTQRMLDHLDSAMAFQDFVGPLGCPSELCKEENLEETKKKKIVFIAGGLGVAPVYPQVKWLHDHGVGVDVIIGCRTKSLLFYLDEVKAVSENCYICTDDGSYGYHRLGTEQLQALYDEGKTYDQCVAIGPMIMMKFACILTKKLNLPTIVSMNPIMLDGTGMCGACRLVIGNEVKFACVDGPEFDGHLVDFDQAMRRMQQYKTEEGRMMLALKEASTHHGGCGVCGGTQYPPRQLQSAWR